MTDPASIAEIIATYKKHGWVLRRVLLSSETKYSRQASNEKLFGEVHVIDSDINAAWFSRPPASGPVAWEIRFLGETPFALLESMDESSEDLEARLSAVEGRLRAAIASKKPA